jgi:hypothetical protein
MRHTLFLALALAGTALTAQNVTGGLQTGLSLPVGDLKDRSGFGTNQFFGAHVGGHLDFNITSHHQVRAQLTYQNLPGSGWGGVMDPKNEYKALQVGADWVYHFQNPNLGWYTIAGVLVNSIKQDQTFFFGGQRYNTSRSQSGRPGVRGGGGFTFNKSFSLEGTLNQISVDTSGTDGFGFDTATWAQVSAVFRFGR